MKEAVSVGVAKLASLVTSSGLDGNVNSTDRCYCSSYKQCLCKETHVDDCEDRCSQSEDQTTRPGPWLLYLDHFAIRVHPELGNAAPNLP